MSTQRTRESAVDEVEHTVEIPSCQTGPGGRVTFVIREITEILRSWLKGRRR